MTQDAICKKIVSLSLQKFTISIMLIMENEKKLHVYTNFKVCMAKLRALYRDGSPLQVISAAFFRAVMCFFELPVSKRNKQFTWNTKLKELNYLKYILNEVHLYNNSFQTVTYNYMFLLRNWLPDENVENNRTIRQQKDIYSTGT